MNFLPRCRQSIKKSQEISLESKGRNSWTIVISRPKLRKEARYLEAKKESPTWEELWPLVEADPTCSDPSGREMGQASLTSLSFLWSLTADFSQYIHCRLSEPLAIWSLYIRLPKQGTELAEQSADLKE